MTILVALNHITDYRYDRLVSMGMQTVRLKPAAHTRSTIQSYSMKVQPENHFINWQQDPFGNFLARLVFPQKTDMFRVEVDLVMEVKVFNPFDFFAEEYATHFPFQYETDLQEELAPYLEIKEAGLLLKKLLKAIPTEKMRTVDFLVAVNQHINQMLKYVVRLEPGVQSCEETLSKGSGSCRDMAWLLCQLLRHIGLATRFASGYLIQLRSDVEALDGPSGPEEDFTDLHAWTEVYLPGAGWVGLDPTSGLFAGEGHIPLCCTPNPSSAAPISGSLEECEAELHHEMTVTRIHEDRRVTNPYSDQEWQAIDKLGHHIDQELQENDVRLTMGGEPTFVSVDDRVSDQWHFSALGDKKKQLSYDLLLRLRDNFTTGALLQHTQGKWYPGEILPRWAMNCYWRHDGQPIWQNPALLANPDIKNAAPEDAERFLQKLTDNLGIAQDYVLPAYEDSLYHLWKENRLPVEGDIYKADLYEKIERQRLVKLLDQDIGQPVGHVLPLVFSFARQNWISNRWQFASGRLILTVGDSPVGFRLPLNSLPYVNHSESYGGGYHERSPFDMSDGLPTYQDIHNYIQRRSGIGESLTDNNPNGFVRSALCAQVRNGNLYIFLPPVTRTEHFLDLITAIEMTAKQLNLPIVLEGYTPPKDSRIEQFSVTPDPGVIEVNIQPSESWEDIRHVTTTLYDQAHQTRLVADKFMVDGRRTGTGGGNHIVMGARTPQDSPFLRRPDLLKSLVVFWQNHPSLSYLFSSLYIGPTSQAPRIDEARHDALYALEIACQQISEDGEIQSWMVDRLFRNILVDLTGNTHRAEFCIDKMYSPDGQTGRLGLLEMRGFEMTPHARMNLLQVLLLRALITHFWQKPYHDKVIRWGTMLHDKFMLPQYVWEDFRSVITLLQEAGYNFHLEWFRPFLDFRFPLYGRVEIGGLKMELRMALEPWPVLGEELTGSGVSRSVDSAIERLQVKIDGLNQAYHVITCNGRRLPLRSTGKNGTYVAGVRFKAWNPPSTLHPTVPVHTPLVFDVVDTRFNRSVGGCTYHVQHPGGSNRDDYPVNENEAQGRRLARFSIGHTPGDNLCPPEEFNSEFVHTLDLCFAR